MRLKLITFLTLNLAFNSVQAQEAPPPVLLELPSKPLTLPIKPLPAAAPNEHTEDTTVYTREIPAPKLLTIDPVSKRQVLEEPVTIKPDFSLMFSQKDMVTLVAPGLELYNRAKQAALNSDGSGEGSEDLTGILESLKIDKKSGDKPEARPHIPNIYLGSILYYSPSNWSVWINGKKIANRVNDPKNTLHVSALDRTHATFVWKPVLFKEFLKVWNAKKTAGMEQDMRFVTLDAENSTVTFTLHPNQTFVPRIMEIKEGLITQTENVTSPEAQPAIPGAGNAAMPTMNPVPSMAVPPAKPFFTHPAIRK